MFLLIYQLLLLRSSLLLLVNLLVLVLLSLLLLMLLASVLLNLIGLSYSVLDPTGATLLLVSRIDLAVVREEDTGLNGSIVSHHLLSLAHFVVDALVARLGCRHVLIDWL